MTVGSQVKNAQVLLAIGDSSGISLIIKVNEVNINNIKVGRQLLSPAKRLHLCAKRKSRTYRATSVSGRQWRCPHISRQYCCSKLTPEQLKIIHMGMSAKVALNIESKPSIRVPISAITVDQGVTTVKIVDEKHGKILTILW